MIKKIFKSQKGEGYIDVVVFILCTLLVVAFALNIFPIYMAKQKTDTFATELIRTAEIAGRIGAETAAEEQRLRHELGISPTVGWSSRGNIQLNGDISVTVTTQANIGLFGGVASFPITLRADASGKSEVYRK